MLINHNIKFSNVKVLSEDNKFIGILSKKDAIQMAQKAQKDLICINENSEPPLCKIMDYGRFQYEQSKAKKSKPPKVELKEIQLRPSTDLHDLKVKANKTTDLLKKHKVRIIMTLRGREAHNRQIALDNFQRFLDLVGDYSIEKQFEQTENQFSITLKGTPVK